MAGSQVEIDERRISIMGMVWSGTDNPSWRLVFASWKGSAGMISRPSFLDYAFERCLKGVLRPVIWYGGLCCDVLDPEGKIPR